jgi:hypothetical protein
MESNEGRSFFHEATEDGSLERGLAELGVQVKNEQRQGTSEQQANIEADE